MRAAGPDGCPSCHGWSKKWYPGDAGTASFVGSLGLKPHCELGATFWRATTNWEHSGHAPPEWCPVLPDLRNCVFQCLKCRAFRQPRMKCFVCSFSCVFHRSVREMQPCQQGGWQTFRIQGRTHYSLAYVLMATSWRWACCFTCTGLLFLNATWAPHHLCDEDHPCHVGSPAASQPA